MTQVSRDERTTGQIHRYGFEVATILFVALTLDLFWKTVIDPRPVGEFLDLVVIVMGMYLYLTIRLGWAGLLWPTGKPKSRSRLVGGLVATLSYLVVFAWVTGPSRLLTSQGLLQVLVSGAVFGMVWFGATALMGRASRHRLEKELGEDSD
jgi:hypothetical protein